MGGCAFVQKHVIADMVTHDFFDMKRRFFLVIPDILNNSSCRNDPLLHLPAPEPGKRPYLKLFPEYLFSHTRIKRIFFKYLQPVI